MTVPLLKGRREPAWDPLCLNGQLVEALLETRVFLEHWRIDYNVYRPDSTHGQLTPVEFAEV
jgi:Integrase core domain